ncbi:MAG: hypothetical protein AAFV80_11850 [Bacteroidota bacterium]
MFELTLILNALWFAGGFHLFALRSTVFAKTLVAKEHRDNPMFAMLIATGKFMGGFNFAFCVLNVLLLLFANTFPDPLQRAILFMVIGLAHGTQFAGNVPIAIANKKGEGAWPVKGLMRFIYVTDFSLMVLNFVLAGLLFL